MGQEWEERASASSRRRLSARLSSASNSSALRTTIAALSGTIPAKLSSSSASGIRYGIGSLRQRGGLGAGKRRRRRPVFGAAPVYYDTERPVNKMLSAP